MANLNVTYDEMVQAANQMNSGKDNLNQQLMQLRSQIQNLISSGFVTDQTSRAFGEACEQFNKNATETVNHLEGVSSYLNKAAQEMQQTDQHLASGISF